MSEVAGTRMAFIQCGGCDAVFESHRVVCPGCVRCPRCGQKRVQDQECCPECVLPYWRCCGQCPGCGVLRYGDVEPCACGHPAETDAAKLREIEEAFPVRR